MIKSKNTGKNSSPLRNFSNSDYIFIFMVICSHILETVIDTYLLRHFALGKHPSICHSIIVPAKC